MSSVSKGGVSVKRIHQTMPDGKKVACDKDAKKTHGQAWSPADVTCPSCLIRLRRFPQLVNAIAAARQLVITDLVLQEAP